MKIIGLVGSKLHCQQVSKVLKVSYGYRCFAINSHITRMLVSIYGPKFVSGADPNVNTDDMSGDELIQSLREWGYSLRSDYWIRRVEHHIETVKKFKYIHDLKGTISDIYTIEEMQWVKKQGGELWVIGQHCVAEQSFMHLVDNHIDSELIEQQDKLDVEIKQLLAVDSTTS